MIKNFFVKVKKVKFGSKGLINLINYLTDEKKHPDGIINLKNKYNKDNFIEKTILNVEKKNLKNKLNKKGGRPIQVYGDSFVFSLPKNTEIKNEELIKIIKELLNGFSNFLGKDLKINKNEFINDLFINIHKNKHIHINIVFPRVFSNLATNNITNKKKFLNYSKTLFNNTLNEVLGLDHKTYKPQTNFKKGYKSIYNKEEIENMNEILELLDKKRKEINEKLHLIFKENEKNEEIIKNMALLLRYIKKLKKEKEEMKKTAIILNIKKKIKELKKYKDTKVKKTIAIIEDYL